MGRSIIQEVTPGMIREMVDIIVGVNSPEKIIMFGSRARGDNKNVSDVDLLIVDDKRFGNDDCRMKEIDEIHTALWKFMVPIDIVLFSTDEVEYWKESKNHIIARALGEGIALYERPR